MPPVRELGTAGLLDVHDLPYGAELTFRNTTADREGLAAIVEAENACCPFLAMSIGAGEDDLSLTITAPHDALAIVRDLVLSFQGAISRNRWTLPRSCGPDAGRPAPSPASPRLHVAHPSWRASAVGVYRLWRDAGYAVGAILAGVLGDLFGTSTAVWAIAALTAGSGFVVAIRMYETHGMGARRSSSRGATV